MSASSLNGKPDPALAAVPDRTRDRPFLAGLLHTMQLNRRFELAVAAEVEAGVVPGMAHLSVGHEATAAGAIAALEARDYVSSTHRAHGHALAKGADRKRMMAEIFGKETGLNHGHGGSLHIVDAVARARSGGGPTFIEASVWRWRPHYEGDLDEYRTAEDKATGEARDPIARFARYMTEAGAMTAAEVEASDVRAAAEVDEALVFARQSPDPNPAEALRDIYVTESVGADNAAGVTAEPRCITMSGAIREALEQEMARDPRVIVLGEDVRLGFFGVTSGLADVFGPERVRDTPISESVIIGGSVGVANVKRAGRAACSLSRRVA